MEQPGRVRVAGPSRALLAAGTATLVTLTSVATAAVLLSGTAAVVRPVPSLEPLPPVAAPDGRPPVVLLPPAALGVPELRTPASAGRDAGASAAGAPRPDGRSLVPELLRPALTAPSPVDLLPASPVTLPAALPGGAGSPVVIGPVAGPVEPAGTGRGKGRKDKDGADAGTPTAEPVDTLGPLTQAARTSPSAAPVATADHARRPAGKAHGASHPPADGRAHGASHAADRPAPARKAASAGKAGRAVKAAEPRPARSSAGRPATAHKAKAKAPRKASPARTSAARNRSAR